MFCVASRNKSKSIIKVRLIFQISQLQKLVSYSKSTNVNVKMSLQNRNFEWNIRTYVFGKSFWYYRELNIDCWTWRHILCEKNIKFFLCVEVRIVVQKWNIYEAHIFPRPLIQKCRLVTNSFCLNTRLRVNKNLQIPITFIEINVEVCLLCAHPVMKSIILHTRRPNCQ